MAEHTHDALATLRHTASHVMAHAVTRLFPGVRLAIGPAIDNGFYYDFAPAAAEASSPSPGPSEAAQSGWLSADDLPRIEDEMRRIAAEDIPLVRLELSRDLRV